MLTASLNGRPCLAGIALALAFALAFALALPAQAADQGAAPPRVQRDIDFYGWWHDAGRLWLHTSNLGFFGTFGIASEASASWPGDSGHEHLYVAGIWVGAVSGGDTLVSTSVYNMEFYPRTDDPIFMIYEASVGAPGGARNVDDDGDGYVDEDRLDGFDNDGDLLTDEDFAAISDEMFAYVSLDTVPNPNPNPMDPHTPMGVELYVQSFAWGDDSAGDFVGTRYEVTNIGPSAMDDTYVGLLVDPDVGATAGDVYYFMDDLVGFTDTTVSTLPTTEPVRVIMAYAHDALGGEDGDWNGWFGVVLLDHSDTGGPSPSPRAFRRWAGGPDDPVHDRDRYRLLSQPLIQGDGLEPSDWRYSVSLGPFGSLSPGETLFFEVAFVCGDKLDGLVDSAARAVVRHRSRLWSGVAGPLPKRPGPALPRTASGDATEEGVVVLSLAPNPASIATRVSFHMAEPGRATVHVYDVTGRLASVVLDRELAAGEHHVDWNDGLESLPTGVYFVRLTTAGGTATAKFMVMR
ncbi:MAG: T9SS type A sorting domain-containing protein [Candidatus Eisenbacteria bacterium]